MQVINMTPDLKLADNLYHRYSHGANGHRLELRGRLKRPVNFEDGSQPASLTDEMMQKIIANCGYQVGEVIQVTDSNHSVRCRVERIDVRKLHDSPDNELLDLGLEMDLWDQAIVMRDYSYSPEEYNKPDFEEMEWFQVWTDEMPKYADYDHITTESFRTYWVSLYGQESWDQNGWVFVVVLVPFEEDMAPATT